MARDAISVKYFYSFALLLREAGEVQVLTACLPSMVDLIQMIELQLSRSRLPRPPPALRPHRAGDRARAPSPCSHAKPGDKFRCPLRAAIAVKHEGQSLVVGADAGAGSSRFILYMPRITTNISVGGDECLVCVDNAFPTQ